MSDSGDVPALSDVCSGDDDSDGWDEMEISGEQTTCLFCTLQFHTIAVALDHCRTEHNFDLLELKTRYNMDCYSFIKMINYIRKHKPDPKSFTESTVAVWDDDLYLKPGEMESWLMYDFDDLGSTPSTPHYAIDGKTPISNNISDLQKQICDLTMQLRQKDSLLKNAMQDMAKMKEITKTWIESRDNKHIYPNSVSTLPTNCTINSDYFSCYAHFRIHLDMLSDTARTESYRDAILKNSGEISGKIVLDVGCGTGILSLFAAKAGAEKVIGIDQSDIAYQAMDIVRENNLHEKIHIIRGLIENTTLPHEKVDIIISEWMGYFLLFEGMLDSFIYARDNHLKQGGILMPNRCSLNLIGCSNQEKHDKLIKFWDDVYGFKMTCMKAEAISDPEIDTVQIDEIITTSALLTEINLHTCTTQSVDFSAKFSLTVLKSGVLTAFAGYFDAFFDLPNPVTLSTNPHSVKTHWQQTIFYFKKPFAVQEGDVIEGQLKCNRFVKNMRGIVVSITVGNESCNYVMG